MMGVHKILKRDDDDLKLNKTLILWLNIDNRFIRLSKPQKCDERLWKSRLPAVK